MTRSLIIYAATLLVFLGIDYVWLSAMGGFYRQEMGSLMRAVPNIAVAGLFYAAYVVGILVFAVRPSDPSMGLAQVALLGALFGALANGFTVKVAVVDMVWGTSLTAICAVAGRLVADRLS
jgi:uncharacterized membrane protein